MKVAVLLSSYNGERYIREQIDSILTQKGDFSLTLWVRDDGSTDQTQQILEEYSRKGQLQWYTGPNLRAAHSFIDLIKHCPGYDFYSFADQDDYWYPEKLQKGIRQIQGFECPAIYFSNAELVDGELNSLNKNAYHRNPPTDFYTLVCQGGVLGCTMIFNSYLAKLVQSRELPGKILLHDYYLAVLCKFADGQLLYDDAPTMKYRQHGHNQVGTPSNRAAVIRDRFRRITHRERVSVAEQAQTIFDQYAQVGSEDKKQWLKKVATYRDSIVGRIALACSHKTCYSSRNMGITLRLAILFGNR